MPTESTPIIKEIKGEKVLVVNTLNGNIVVSQAALDRADEVNKKVWRPLSAFVYPTYTIGEDLVKRFPAHLLFHLHRTFKDAGYTEFSSLIYIDEGDKNAAQPVDSINLISQHPRYVGAMTNLLRKLWGDDPDREALQAEMNEELTFLQKNWLVSLQIMPVTNMLSYQFVYDPEGMHISIKPLQDSPTNPNAYPNQLTRTSELFDYLAARSAASIAVVDYDVVLRSYALFKLELDMLDECFSFQKIRIATTDPEEWDYLNPEADRSWQSSHKK